MSQIRPIDGLSYVRGPNVNSLFKMPLPIFFGRALDKYPNKEAVVFPQFSVRWTYSELLQKSDDFASGLLSLGLYKGDRVGIWSPNRPEWIIAQIATARLGIILVNVNPAYKSLELKYCINKVELKALIFATQFKTSSYATMLSELVPEFSGQRSGSLKSEKLPSLKTLIQMSAHPIPGAYSFDEVCQKSSSRYHSRLDLISKSLTANDAINIQFTSGTTGAPKGATLSHENIINNAVFCAKSMNLTCGDRLCIPVPLYHCFGMVMGVLACFSVGATMVFPGESFDPEMTLAVLRKENCTAVHGVPTMFSAILDSQKFKGEKVKSLRTGIMAGSQCPEPLMRRVIKDLGCSEITIAYGMTETSPVSFQSDVSDSVDVRVSTVGRIQPHCEVKIVDDNGATVPVGETGELWVKGYLVMKGYWDDLEANKNSIHDNWMKSGDLASIDIDGFCRIVGRKKDMVIRGGENIYPAEVEDFLTGQLGVLAAHVFGFPDPKFGEVLIAWVIKEPNSTVSAEGLTKLCNQNLAYYKTPSEIRFVKEVPLTVTGKPQKFRMKEIMLEEQKIMKPQIPNKKII